MDQLTQILKTGVTVQEAYEGLKKREEALAGPLSLRERGEYILRNFPQMAQKRLDQAGECLEGYTILPGSKEKHFIGNPPLWKENPFADAEYTFQISRMGHWVPMLEAYSMTGDEAYAGKVISELLDWIANCPIPPVADEQGRLQPQRFDGPDSKWWRVLECGIRLFESWAALVRHLSGSRHFTQQVFEKLLASVYEQAIPLYRISPHLWPKADHNHYIMENLGLLQAACMFPELAAADAWREHAIRELCRCMQAQVTVSGGQIEGCPSYHNGTIYWFSLLIVYANRYGFSIPASYTESFRKMFDYSVQATRPNGWNVPWGDSSSSGGFLVSAALQYYVALEEPRPLRICRHFYPQEQVMNSIWGVLWRVKDIQKLMYDLEDASANSCPPPLPAVFWDRALKQAFLRTGWDRDALSVFFACRTPIQNLHAHIDPNGFDLSAFGSPIIVDPGRYSYRDGIDRYHFKCSGWHNTLTLNHRDAWEYQGSWAYGAQEEGDILAVRQAGELAYAVGSHENYAPMRHTRLLALAYNSFVLVLDLCEGLAAGDTIQVQYHFDRPMAELSACGSRVQSNSARANASVTVSGDTQLALIPAKVSDYNDVWRDSAIARFECAAPPEGGRLAVAAVIAPSPAGAAVRTVRGLQVRGHAGSFELCFILEDQPYTFLFDQSRNILSARQA